METPKRRRVTWQELISTNPIPEIVIAEKTYIDLGNSTGVELMEGAVIKLVHAATLIEIHLPGSGRVVMPISSLPNEEILIEG